MGDLFEILAFVRINYPSGCSPEEIGKSFIYGKEILSKGERDKVYYRIRKLVDSGSLVKVYDGFYRPKVSLTRRRYYLHRRVRKYFKVEARERYVEYYDDIDVPEIIKEQLKELAYYGYNVQFTIR